MTGINMIGELGVGAGGKMDLSAGLAGRGGDG